MPSARSRWAAVGRLLPQSVRERVFEPAFADLLRASLESQRAGQSRVPFGVRVVGTYLGCVPPAVVRMFVHRGRPTRLARAAGVVAGVVVVLTLLSAWASQAYGAP